MQDDAVRKLTRLKKIRPFLMIFGSLNSSSSRGGVNLYILVHEGNVIALIARTVQPDQF